MPSRAPAKPAAPTRDEVLALPFWPRVAFCARVARRLLPLVDHCRETEVPPEYKYLIKPGHARAVRRCVRQTELAAANAAVVNEKVLYDAQGAAYVAASQAEFAANLAQRPKYSPQYAASYAAHTAAIAGSAAFHLLKPDWNIEFGLAVFFATEAGKAMNAAEAVEAALRADYETLKRRIEGKGWGAETAVSPKVFGPLWPQGLPQGWPTG
jgi:hypothetical protein